MFIYRSCAFYNIAETHENFPKCERHYYLTICKQFRVIIDLIQGTELSWGPQNHEINLGYHEVNIICVIVVIGSSKDITLIVVINKFLLSNR